MSMTKPNNKQRREACGVIEQQGLNKLIAKLLQLLIRHCEKENLPDTAKVLNQLREVNESVNIIARHLKREYDEKTEADAASNK